MKVIAVCLLFGLVAEAKPFRVVNLDESKMATIYVKPGQSTILSFPVKPSKVVLGNKGSFAIQYVEEDLAINALGSQVRSNLFVYLHGIRYGFNLVASFSHSDSVVHVRDSKDKLMEVKLK